MSSASDFPRGMPVPWSIDNFAEAIPCPRRQADDLSRIPEAGFPAPFGRVGNSRLWDPLVAQAALPAIRKYIAGAPQRNAAKREIELRQQEEAYARRKAEFEREAAWGREQSQMRQENARIKERQMEANKKPREAIIIDAHGRRVS